MDASNFAVLEIWALWVSNARKLERFQFLSFLFFNTLEFRNIQTSTAWNSRLELFRIFSLEIIAPKNFYTFEIKEKRLDGFSYFTAVGIMRFFKRFKIGMLKLQHFFNLNTLEIWKKC